MAPRTKAAKPDYMPIEEFRRRHWMQVAQGWQPILPHQEIIITPTYHAAFDAFAHSTAHAIRHYIVYRSDGGKFARGLVRSTGDLQNIHADLTTMGIPEGAKVRLAAALYRRKHADPKNRYMMAVQFAHIPVVGDEEVIEASPQVTAQSDENLGNRIIDWAEQAAQEKSWSGDRKKRIGDWAALARRVGYPKFLDLWHYNRGVVALYVQIQFEHLRPKMTGGKPPPFDGDWGGAPWRVYPFRLLMNECKHVTDIDQCYGKVANQLRRSEEDILAMIDDVYKAMIKYQSAFSQDYRAGSITGSAEAKYKDLAPFLEDLKKQLYDMQTLMGTYTKYTQAQTGLWDGF